METTEQIQIFKQVLVRWLNDQLNGIMGDGALSKFLRPIADEVIAKYQKSPVIDAVLSIFVDEDGNFNIDQLLDKYITALVTDGSIRFRWSDISPKIAFVDMLTGNKVNVITAEDIKQLKDAFMAALK